MMYRKAITLNQNMYKKKKKDVLGSLSDMSHQELALLFSFTDAKQYSVNHRHPNVIIENLTNS